MAALFTDADVRSLDARVREARKFAGTAHGTQRYGTLPYLAHLDAVVRILVDFQAPVNLQVAAYLHDVLEDTPTRYAEVEAAFGSSIAAIVFAVTNEGPDVSVEHACYRKISELGSPAAIVKTADRLANTFSSLQLAVEDKPRAQRYLEKYRKDFEHLRQVIEPLARDSVLLSHLWNSLVILQGPSKNLDEWIAQRLQAKWNPWRAQRPGA
jgi:(p)ppGpp synthase/HD superfamily hydrolase